MPAQKHFQDLASPYQLIQNNTIPNFLIKFSRIVTLCCSEELTVAARPKNEQLLQY